MSSTDQGRFPPSEVHDAGRRLARPAPNRPDGAENTTTHGGFPQMGIPYPGYPKMDGLYWKGLLKWMIWGYPYFRETPTWSFLRRGDTKGSCVTGDAGDHSVRKPTCDRALFCWHQALGLSIWTSCASKSPLWQNEGKISVQPKHGEAPTFLCFTRLLAKVKVTWQMDVEKSESQVEWWWRWWWWRWCWWWDTAKGLLREETHKACDESSPGGGMELDIQSRAEISGSEKRAPHDVHGCSSLSLFK